MGLDTKTYWLTDRQSQCDFDFDLPLRLPYFNVTSGEKRCSKGTPIIKKSNPSLFIKGGTTKEEKKQKSWHWTNIWPWVPTGLDARSDRAGCLPAVSYCSALLLRESLQPAVRRVWGWCEMAASLRGREPRNRGTSTVGRCYLAEQWRL
jgi:hypothetical protein